VTLLDELGPRPLGLGTAGFAFGSATAEQAVATILAAAECGIRLIDTARAYTRAGEESTAEALVARARRARPDLLVATKGGHWREGDGFPIDGRPDVLRRHCEDSVRILGVEAVDLYQLHHVDPAVPIEESAAALAELQRDGFVRYIGLSNVTIEQLDAASRVARIDAVQNRLSLAGPADTAVAAECARRGIAFLAYSPLGGTRAATPAAVARVAARHGVSPAQVLLAWLLAASDAIVPLVGATRVESVRDSASARERALTPDDLRELARSIDAAGAVEQAD
jgi:aryl-alcohol dehydrogenase-like predicted oxidoreductase